MKYRGGSTALSAGGKGGNLPGTEGNLALRRASSIRRAFTSSSAGLKRHSSVLQVFLVALQTDRQVIEDIFFNFTFDIELRIIDENKTKKNRCQILFHIYWTFLSL